MSKIPVDAREVYCDEQGEPIAYCPEDGLGLTDIIRARFFTSQETRLREMQVRAKTKGEGFCVVCIDVDDACWEMLVHTLMPGHDWDQYRARGEKPVARGVVPRDFVQTVIDGAYPAAGKMEHDGCIVVFAAGGAGIFT